MIIYAVTSRPDLLEQAGATFHVGEQLAQERRHAIARDLKVDMHEGPRVVPVRLQETASGGPRRMAGTIRVIRDSNESQLQIDGAPFPWLTAEGWHIDVARRGQPGVTLTVIAQRVEVLHATSAVPVGELMVVRG